MTAALERNLKADLARLRQANDGLRLDLQLANDELTKLRRQKTAAENREREELQAGPDFELIERLFTYWQAQCDHPGAELGPKRIKIVGVRLRQRAKAKRIPVEMAARDIAEAIKGAAVSAYVDEKGVRHDDLELICRDEVKLESFISRYHVWKAQHP